MPTAGRDLPAVRLASRRSPLARRQAELVAALVGPPGGVELVGIETTGDRDRERSLDAFAQRGIFAAEVDLAVLDGRADFAVHSAKDLPAAAPPPGLVLAAVPSRADPRDVLVGGRLDELAPGALIATGAIRRRVQLAAYRSDLGFTGLRGNIGTRLEQIPDGGAVVVALAALERLQLLGKVSEILPTSVVLPQVGQGALALTCREDDERTLRLLRAVDDPVAHRTLDAERSFLARLGAGCSAPIGALAAVNENGEIVIEGMLASADGHVLLRRHAVGADPVAIGRELAERLLVNDGGSALLGVGGAT